MKFNLLSKTKNQTVNYEGAKAFTLSPEMELYTAVVTWSLNDSFYEKDEARLMRLQKLITACDPEFVGKLAVYARKKMYMRSVLPSLFERATLNQQHSILNRVFKQGLTFKDEGFRTPWFNPQFGHNYQILKKKVARNRTTS
jgi:hypothetical protein